MINVLRTALTIVTNFIVSFLGIKTVGICVMTKYVVTIKLSYVSPCKVEVLWGNPVPVYVMSNQYNEGYWKLPSDLGVQGQAKNWFTSYLHGRSQVHSWNTAHSQWPISTYRSTPQPISRGVLQGSVLFIVLFILMTKDFPPKRK